MDEVYLRLSNGYLVNLFWSSNDPCDPNVATGVIDINVYNPSGDCIDGGELDVTDESEIIDNVVDCLELVGFPRDISYEEITEEEFYKVVKD